MCGKQAGGIHDCESFSGRWPHRKEKSVFSQGVGVGVVQIEEDVCLVCCVLGCDGEMLWGAVGQY
jgi:hypothetical protein